VDYWLTLAGLHILDALAGLLPATGPIGGGSEIASE